MRSWGRAGALQLPLTSIHDAPAPASIAMDSPSLVPVRPLVGATALTAIVAQLLSQMTGYNLAEHDGPLGIVIGQAIWNAAQVGHLLLLLCLWRVSRDGWVVALTVATVLCLPFALYAISPGGVAFTVLLLATCALAYVRRAPDMSVVISDAPARGTPALAKFELLAFVCTLLCSLYNFNLSAGYPPYWASGFRYISDALGLPADHTVTAEAMYTLGLSGATLPAFINIGSKVSSFGAAVFATIWAVLPFAYVVYFAILAKLARYSPGTRVQQAFCLVGIVHFLFLTDLVDYRFGCGIMNHSEELAHWVERFSWHAAILLPIYQKVTTGHWLRGNGLLGVALHFAVAAYAIGYFIRQVVILDVIGFYYFVTGTPAPNLRHLDLGLGEKLSYPAALLLMTLVYGFAFVFMRCKHISTFGGARTLAN